MRGSVQSGGSAASRIRAMFGAAAPHYDRINRLTSFGRDHHWRVSVLKELDLCPEDALLDICCGTGDLALLALKEGVECRGLDFSPPMLEKALAKEANQFEENRWICGDASHLPFADSSFSAAACAFGLRNTVDPQKVLSESARVLKPRGRMAILEFFPIPGKVWGPLFRFYFHKVLPHWAEILGAQKTAYQYLPASVDQFPAPSVVEDWMRLAGFSAIRSKSFAGGVARLVVGSLGKEK